MAYIRKAGPGGNSLGYTWPHAGAIVEVADEHVATLLATPYNDFTVVDAPDPAEAEPEAEPETEIPPMTPDIAIEEPAPEAQLSEAPPTRRSSRGRGKNAESAGDAASVEE